MSDKDELERQRCRVKYAEEWHRFVSPKKNSVIESWKTSLDKAKAAFSSKQEEV